MTANELAEALDYIGEHYYAGWGNVMFKDAAIFVKKQAEQIELLQNDIVKQQEFVCQQAQEIEALKKELALQKLSDIGQMVENEPVAWMNSLVKEDIAPEQDITHNVPLYTKPLGLTFAEILYREQVNECKKLLNKASEK